MRLLVFGASAFTIYLLQRLLNTKQEICGLVLKAEKNPEIEALISLAQHNDWPYWQLENLNDPDFIDLVKAKLKPDLILVLTFDKLIPQALYSLAKIAALNLHPSWLPYYRGFYPYYWPIFKGDSYTGVTYHYLTEKFDHGDIVAQQKVVINPNDTSGQVVERQKPVAWELLQSILEEAEKSGQPPKGKPQPEGDFPKGRKLKSADLFINWNLTAEKIIRQIQALNPFSPAYTHFRQEIIGIYQARPYKLKAKAENGTIVRLTDNGFVVKTEAGAVEILVVICPNKYLLQAKSFVANEGLKVNERFGLK